MAEELGGAEDFEESWTDEAGSPCPGETLGAGGGAEPAEYSWQRAFREAGEYAERFLARPLGQQAAAEGWSQRLRSYVQIAAWRQLCAGAGTPEVEVPAACIEHWRLCWSSGIRVAPVDAEMTQYSLQPQCAGAASNRASPAFCANGPSSFASKPPAGRTSGRTSGRTTGEAPARNRPAVSRSRIAPPPGAPLLLARDPASGVEVAVGADDRGTPERRQHDAFERVDVLVGGELRRVAKVSTQTPLDRYRRRAEISEEQWRAGERLRQDFILASLNQRVTAAYEERRRGGSDDWSERRLAARERFVAALRAVGTVLSPVLMHVSCLDGRASDWAASRGHRGRRAEIAGMTALQLGLDALGLHYRSRRRRTAAAPAAE